MADIITLKTKAKDKIYSQFPPLGKDEVPQLYEIKPIEYKRASIDEYEVVFWHRLLKTIYQEPLDIECELHVKQANTSPETAILRRLEEKSEWEILNTTKENALKIQSGEIKPFPMNWRYFIKLPSEGIIVIGTKDQHTALYCAHIVGDQVQDEDKKQAETFISLLLDEANKARNQLFNPEKDFKKLEGLKSYLLFNVYLANYVSAGFMFNMAVTQEEHLREESIKYDMRTSDRYDQEKTKHSDQFMLTCGMYFLSAITYYFMALEGFINIVFHCFLKKDLRDSHLNIEKRFDIEQKLKLLPVLCDGFLQEGYNGDSDIYPNFRKLSDYRNNIFHSKVENSLKSLNFIEDGFLYNSDVSKYTEQFLPNPKMNLSASDVIKVSNIVDEIIKLILSSMTDDAKKLTRKYILDSTHIPILILDDGSLSMGGGNVV